MSSANDVPSMISERQVPSMIANFSTPRIHARTMIPGQREQLPALLWPCPDQFEVALRFSRANGGKRAPIWFIRRIELMTATTLNVCSYCRIHESETHAGTTQQPQLRSAAAS
jgi:hypothetical protein